MVLSDIQGIENSNKQIQSIQNFWKNKHFNVNG